MNYKALATIFLLALPLMLPIALANQPPPQLWNVELRIRPGATKYWGPCVVSTIFPIDVYLWNDKTLTGNGTYAYDFYVYWKNNVGISLDSFTNIFPWPTGKYYLVINATGTFGPDPTYDYFHVAVTAIGNATLDPSLELGTTGVFNASILRLNFHIDSEPFWPANVHSDFLIGGPGGGYFASTTPPYAPDPDPTHWPIITNGCTGQIMNIEVDHGTYDLYSSQPNIDPHAELAAPFAQNITVSAKGVTESVYIHLTNITGAYGFSFHLTFNPSWKQTDVQHIFIQAPFAPPYALLTEAVNNNTGDVYFTLIKPSEKPTICTKDIAVVKIDFVSTPQVPLADLIPSAPYYMTQFAIVDSWIAVKDKTHSGFYAQSANTPTPPYPVPAILFGYLYYSGDLPNVFKPKSPADITFDGTVDIADLAKVASKYGLTSDYSNFVTPGGKVDIFDIVFVAKRYGDPAW